MFGLENKSENKTKLKYSKSFKHNCEILTLPMACFFSQRSFGHPRIIQIVKINTKNIDSMKIGEISL